MTRRARIRPGHRWPANKPDIRRLSFASRGALTSDNLLAIIAGGWYTCAIPIELFRAMSKCDKEIDMHHPNGPAVFLPDIETWPVLEILARIRQLVEKEAHAKLEVMRDNNGALCTYRDLSLVRAGRLLGMELYVNEMYDVYANHIKRGALSLEDVDDIVRLAPSEDDALFKRLGSRLGEMVLCGDAQKVFPWLWRNLEDHPWLKHWVNKELEDVESHARTEK